MSVYRLILRAFTQIQACVKNFSLNIGLAFAELESIFTMAARALPPAMLACACVHAVDVDIFFFNKTGVYPPTHKRKRFVQPKMMVIMDDP